MILSIDEELYESQIDLIRLFHELGTIDKNIYYLYGANHIQGVISEDADFIVNQFLLVQKKFFYMWGRRVYVIRGEFDFDEITSDNLKHAADLLLNKFKWYQSVYTIQEYKNKRYFTLVINNYSYDKNHQDRKKFCYVYSTSGLERILSTILLQFKNK